MPDVASLEPRIYAILMAPAVDLNSISAKRVRAQLRANDPELGDDWVRANKEEIDKLTAAVFERVRSGGGEKASESPSPPSPVASPAPAPAKAVTTSSKGGASKKKSPEEAADAEYARKLASELNGHKTRGGSAGAQTTKKKAGNGKRKAKKSAEEIQESDEEDEEPAKKTKKKRKTAGAEDEDGGTKKRGGGFQKEYALSSAMAEFTGAQALSRPQIVKKLWDHIKANNLQNPADKREILCDDAMQQVFGVNRINMFQMNKMVSNHVFEPQEST
ncbi:hypothetical protein FRC12_005306 [Ceratobasidium sp. 428]|nr:hypothetical protein FRC12_005306 [Ceratobasidium sp. 428]